jgi:hypothetical protein
LRGGKARTGAIYLGNELRRIVPMARPSGAENRHVAGLDGYAGKIQMPGCDDKILRQSVNSFELRDVEQNTATEDGLDSVHGMALETGHIILDASDFLAAKELSVAGEVA